MHTTFFFLIVCYIEEAANNSSSLSVLCPFAIKMSSSTAETSAANGRTTAMSAPETELQAGSSSSVTETNEAMSEEEAALYDRQLRLWGSEAQSRIRQCRVLIAPFQGGLAIEVAKNLILAGVKEIVLLDDGIVDEAESLTAGFVWRKEDVGKVRVEAALPRLSSLNPHVTITPIAKPPNLASINSYLKANPSRLSSLAYTNSNPFDSSSLKTLMDLVSLNQLCREHSSSSSSSEQPTKKFNFHLAAAQGLDGFIFQDLGQTHQFLVEKRKTSRDSKNATVESTWTEMQKQSFATLGEAMAEDSGKASRWKGRSATATKRNLRGSEGIWANLALWQLIQDKTVLEPKALQSEPQLLVDAMEEQLRTRELPVDLFWQSVEGLSTPLEWASTYIRTHIPLTSTSQPADFAPTTAVLGGVLSQEILNSVGGREAPKVANWMHWYGLKGQAPVFSLGQTMTAATDATVALAAAE
ncbi:unnamed protein product [Jaminaea pallidilutea]